MTLLTAVSAKESEDNKQEVHCSVPVNADYDELDYSHVFLTRDVGRTQSYSRADSAKCDDACISPADIELYEDAGSSPSGYQSLDRATRVSSSADERCVNEDALKSESSDGVVLDGSCERTDDRGYVLIVPNDDVTGRDRLSLSSPKDVSLEITSSAGNVVKLPEVEAAKAKTNKTSAHVRSTEIQPIMQR